LIPHRLVGEGKVVESDASDNVSFVIEWDGGQQALLRTLASTSMTCDDFVIYGRRGTLWIPGIFGSSDLVIHSPGRAIPGAEAMTWRGYANCYRIPFQAPENEDLIEHFADCIQRKVEPTCGWQQALHVSEILFKGLEAARTGMAQELESTFTPWHKIDPAFLDARTRPV
jgi:predicted dehydrogenase